MPVDFTQILKNFDGEELADVIAKDGKPTSVPLTLSRIVCTALLGALPGEPQADAEEHLKRFLLAEQVRGNKAADLTVEQLAEIKTRLTRAYNNAQIVGQAVVMLDPGAVAQATSKQEVERSAAKRKAAA